MNIRWLQILLLSLLLLTACSQVHRPLFSPLPLPEMSPEEKGSLDENQEQAWTYLLTGDPDKALNEFKKSRSSELNSYTGFGFVYYIKKNYTLAEKNFRKALAIQPDDLMAQAGLGLLFEAIGKNEGAFAQYRSIKRTHPSNPWVQIRFDRVRVLLTEMHITLAEQAKNNGNLDVYLQELLKAQSYSPDLTDVSLKIATRFQELGQPDKAISAYRQLLRNDPQNPAFIEKLAETYLALKQYDNALIFYRRLLDFNPEDEVLKARVEEVKKAFDESSWPREMKNIFFKAQLNREDTAALIGRYFPSVLAEPQRPLIISDISGSYAFKDIIRVCANGIMTVRPDHRFDRFGLLDRGQGALVLNRLLMLISDRGYILQLEPDPNFVPPHDIPTTHRDYQTITTLISLGLINLDQSSQFHPQAPVTPDEMINALKRIEMAIQFDETQAESQMTMNPGEGENG